MAASTARTMVHGEINGILLCIHNASPPDPEEWAAYMATFRKHAKSGKMKQLVVTEGGGPNTAMRNEINSAVKGVQNVVSVITASAMIRGVVTALNWFNPDVKAFAPDRIKDGLVHLGVSAADMPRLINEARTLHGRLQQRGPLVLNLQP